jgi:hypothetical protein
VGCASDNIYLPADTDSSRNSVKAAGWFPKGEEPCTRHWRRRLEERVGAKWDSFSWLTVRALIESVNDVLAKGGPTVVRRRRVRWVAAQRAAGVERPDTAVAPGDGSFGPDFVIDRTARYEAHGNTRFLLLGDPGEADASQYAVIDPLLHAHVGNAPGRDGGPPSDFMVIVSDVIYPAGDVNEYVNAFYRPYEDYTAPIYAIPGNHDWYDGLNGFMFHFCAAEPIRKPSYRLWSYGPAELLALLLWRGASPPNREALAPWISKRVKAQRGSAPSRLSERTPCGEVRFDETYPEPPPIRRPVQPGPYFAIDVGPLMIVSIDTGVLGELDAEQGDWLRRVSSTPKAKVLLTGKPIYVNNEYHPNEISWGDDAPETQREIPGEKRKRPLTVDDIVRERANCYLAAIGGDIHNYQRYPVRLTDGRTIQYIVSGGGGAYLSATHMIPTVNSGTAQDLPPDVEGFSEDGARLHDGPADGREADGSQADGRGAGQTEATELEGFRCYPLRGDSLALFTRRVGPVLFNVIASSFVLVAAALIVLWQVLEDELGARYMPVVWSSLGAALLTLAIVAGFTLRDALFKLLPRGYRAAILAAAAALIGVGLTALLAGIGKAPVSQGVGVTMALPFILLAGVVLAYELRGSAPRFSKSLMLIAPIVALWAIFVPSDVPEWAWVLVYLMGPLVFSITALVLLEWAKASFADRGFYPAYRVALSIAWVALTIKVLVDQAGGDLGDVLASDDWLTWFILAVLATIAVVARVVPLSRPAERRVRVHTPAPHRTGETAGTLVAIALLTLALLALDAIGDGWPAHVVAAALFGISGWASVGLLLGSVIGLGMTPRALWYLRTGEIDAAYAAKFVSERIGGPDPVREATIDYNDQRKRGMAEVVRRLGKSVSEIADTNEPPFYKSFLDVEVNDRTLIIRCYGVTGYSERPTLEDRVVIQLPQPASMPVPPLERSAVTHG